MSVSRTIRSDFHKPFYVTKHGQKSEINSNYTANSLCVKLIMTSCVAIVTDNKTSVEYVNFVPKIRGVRIEPVNLLSGLTEQTEQVKRYE